MARWQLQAAKARLGEVVRTAFSSGPQEITLHRRPAAVVLRYDDDQRLQAAGSTFVDFIRQSPLCGAELLLERDRGPG